MKPEVETFDAELQELLQNTDTTAGLVNRVGNNIAHETNLLHQLRNAIEQNSDARYSLLEELSRPQRVPLDETRRDQLATSIEKNLPRVAMRGTRPATPPPVPNGVEQHPQPSPFPPHN